MVEVNRQLFIKLMQNTEEGLLKLPRRAYNIPLKFSKNASKTCLTNFYEVDLGGKMNYIYQYSFDCEPAIPGDSKDLLHRVIRSIRAEVKEKIDIITFSGHMLWGLKQLPIPLNVKSQFKDEPNTYKFDVIIKPAKKLSVEDLRQSPNGEQMLGQIFNNKIKQILREKKMDELTRGKYFDEKEVVVKEVGLSIIRGFKFTLCTLKSGLFLQIDVCSRVFRSFNFLEELMNQKNKDFNDSLLGSTLITNYGRRRTYRILRICYDMTPYSKFYHDKRAGMVTFAQYYQENYALRVSDKKQPLVEVVIRVEKKYDQVKGTEEKKDILGYLIPEFVSLTGMSDEQRADYKTMKEIAPYTKLKPDERMKQTGEIAQIFNNSGKISVKEPKKINAYQLIQPYVLVKGNNVVKNHNDGSMNIKDRLRDVKEFKDWVVVYSQGRNPKFDDQDADALYDIFNKAGEAFGLKFSEPGFITCQSNVNQWKKEIKTDIEKNGKPQIIVLYFNGPHEERFYGELKRFITCELKLSCQGIRRRTIVKAKNPMSAASKIIIQMNQKVGGTAWEIIPQEGSYTSKKKTMYGAIAISKGKKGFTLAFAGTIDTNFTRVFTFCKTGYKAKEAIPQADYEAMFVNWARSFVSINKQGPELIIVYREGLSVQQIERQVKGELAALDRVIQKIGEKTKRPDYKPEIIYTTVNTKINTRIFDFSEGSSATHSNKFTPRADNPKSGTVAMDELSVEERYDFHLAAQRVTEGTCTPTLYTVVKDSSKMPQEAMTQFTYEQCFNYYNWTGAVKVPAALQCANKVAKLVGESIQTDVNAGEVLTSYYFL